jgi:hypothetical protein
MICVLVLSLLHCVGCRKAAANYLSTGVTWILTAIHYSPTNIVDINRPFSIVFKEDREADMVVDCNRCSYIYEITADKEITFSTGKCTEAYCGVDSHDREFHAAINSAFRFIVEGNRLEIYFDKSGSKLLFTAE